MRTRTHLVVIGLAVLAMATATSACKKTVKGETSRWDASNRKVDDLAVLYPSFKSALEDQRSRAKTVFDAAQAIEGDEAKAKKMSEANTLLSGGFIAQLGAADATIKSIRSKLVEAGAVAVDTPLRARAEAVSEEAKRTLADVDKRLRAGARDAGGARAVLEQVTNDLQHAERLLTELMPKPTPAAGTAGATPEPVGDTAPTSWTCEFCDHQNEAEASTCANCGAAKPAPK
ncbi:MAG TPA: Ran-binding zinc finger domain-containing protein [Kofleriaceae bacterium]|nr:Ran-binding zinc finger domain-containing protein [Kofleriaceae bacterium]